MDDTCFHDNEPVETSALDMWKKFKCRENGWWSFHLLDYERWKIKLWIPQVDFIAPSHTMHLLFWIKGTGASISFRLYKSYKYNSSFPYHRCIHFVHTVFIWHYLSQLVSTEFQF